MNVKHFNRALRVHKMALGALQRLLSIRFVEMNPQFELLSQETHNMLMYLIDDPCKENPSKTRKNSKIVSMIRNYHNHKLQTTPWHREEETLNHHETPGRQIKQSNQLSLPHQSLFQRYCKFTSGLLDGIHGKTAQFWMRYMDIFQKILTLIRATKYKKCVHGTWMPSLLPNSFK